jgi:hypothetical protein
MLMELTFKRKILKVFLHPPPPPEWERFVKAVGLMIQRLDILSIPKMRL